jgi:hypothetical protein
MLGAALVSRRSGDWRRVLGFAAGVLPGPVAIAWLNAQLVGGAFASGYGTVETLFSLANLPANARHYFGAMAATSPVFAGGLILFVLPWPIWTVPHWRRGGALLAMTALAAVAPYLFYQPFQEWWYLRFLLPAWPALSVAAALAIERVRLSARPSAATALHAAAICAGAVGLSMAHSHGAFAIGAIERRYATVARLVDAHTEPSAVILTSQHSGTVRYYAGRETIRLDVIDPAWVDRAIVWLNGQGRHPYFLVEDWEQPIFERQLRTALAHSTLSGPPLVAWQSGHIAGWVWLYDPLQSAPRTEVVGPELERTQTLVTPPARSMWGPAAR